MERQGGRGRRLGARTRAVAGGVEPGPRRMLSILTAVIDRRYRQKERPGRKRPGPFFKETVAALCERRILTAVIDRRYSLHFGLFRVSVRGTRGGHGFLLLCTCAQAQSTGQNSRDHDHF